MSSQARSRLIEAIARDESAQAGPQRVASTRARALSAVADVRAEEGPNSTRPSSTSDTPRYWRRLAVR